MDDLKEPAQIVAIGASAGGMNALSEFFGTMPGDSGLAFVVIQHLDPHHESHMAGLLAKVTPMKTVQAEDRMPIEANCVYTIPPGKFLAVDNGLLRLSEPIKSDGIRLPIDFFLRSLAQDQHEKSIAVLLSGSGSDGTIGIREVSAAGGIVIAQDPASAQFDSMIVSAIATGRVDSVLPVREMAGALLEYVRRLPAVFGATEGEATREHVAAIIDLVARRTENDFRHYKHPTLQRRVARRMGLKNISQVADYYRLLEQNRDELEKLAKDLLISVTSFFRDPDAFAELGRRVITPLIQEIPADRPLRLWCVGCSTGEEVYSLAILIMEEMARNRKKFPMQIFASDIDAEAVKVAREGVYPASIAADVTAERLARFFIKKEHLYQIDGAIREVITFARHNVMADPPFMKMDLISCRNMLIYIDGEMQKKILDLFAFALNPGGYLFLGKSETSGDQSDAFEPISRAMRIFRRNRSVAVQVANFPVRAGAPVIPRIERPSPVGLSELNQQVLLSHFNASVVLVDEHGKILHFYGPSQKFLAHPFGDANLNLYDMVGSRNSSTLRLAVQKAIVEDVTIKPGPMVFSHDGDSQRAAITITPIVEPKSNRKLLAIIFETVAQPVGETPVANEESADGRQRNNLVQDLEREIARLKDELRATVESFQTTHQELSAANEEILAINEELQSSNEELETSKEEMQSVNEELITVNSQLTVKLEELSRANDDLANFLNSSEVSTIFLNNEFCIRRFTPSTTKLVNVMARDIGRPIGNISTNLVNVDLTSVAANVLKELTQVETEVQALDGRWHMMRCLPYRTLGNVIDGTVFTFTDVTSLKQSEAALVDAKNLAEDILNSTSVALLMLDSELKVISANRAFYKTFKVTAEETTHRSLFEIGNRQWDTPRLRTLLARVIHENSPLADFKVEHNFPRIGAKVMLLNAKSVSDDLSAERHWLLTIVDVTARHQAERDVRLSGERLLQVFEGASTAMVLATADGSITRINARVEKLFGYRRSELIGNPVEMLVPERFRLQHATDRAGFFANPKARAMGAGRDLYGLRKDGTEVPVEVDLSPISWPEGVQVMMSIIDITERKRTEEALRATIIDLTERTRSEDDLRLRVDARTEELELANRELVHDIETRRRLEDQLRQSQKLESIGTLAAGIAHDFNNILNIISGFASILRPHGEKIPEIGESLEIIDAQVTRGAALAQQLLTIGRKTEGRFAATDINAMMSNLARMLRETIPKTIETKLELRPELPTVKVDANQISQAVLNLCVNARDAMPEGGKLTIKTDLVEDQSLPEVFERTAQHYVSIEISDTGTGIDERVREHLFEPFMTTKEIGHGSGLGLAVAYGIVQSHNGFIQVESEPQQGSRFQIFLPAFETAKPKR